MGCPYCGAEVKPGRTYCSPGHALMHNHSSGSRAERAAEKAPRSNTNGAVIDSIMAQPEIEQLRAGIKVAVRAALERVLQG